jgi:small neutral amino acid transporter SnatA (MarC family)
VDLHLPGLLSVGVRVVVPIFVAMDPLGTLPLIFAWTGGLNDAERERQLRDALITALALGLMFVLAGRWLLGILGVEIPDFLVAGGLVLLVLAISDLWSAALTKAAEAPPVLILVRCQSALRFSRAPPRWRLCWCSSTTSVGW